MAVFENLASFVQDNFPSIVFGIFVIWWLSWTERPKRACKCGRSKFFYFRPTHRRCSWMVVAGLFFVIPNVSSAYLDVVHIRAGEGLRFSDWVNTIANACVEIYIWRWVYFHEKDRFRSVSKAFGRIFVNKHGRLAVKTDG